MFGKVNYLRFTQQIRNLRSKARFKRDTEQDPGIRRIAAVLRHETDVDYDDFELESDFTTVGRSYAESKQEMEKMREMEKLHIVRQKYFKQKLPNFLTYADKQQIKLLHSRDPVEWNVNKLSEGFPALPHIIKKILKSKWSKSSNEAIQKHDQNVQNNWNAFKSGKLNTDLPPDLVDHLHRFTSRSLNMTPIDFHIEEKKIVLPEGEFSEIIKSYEKLRSKNALIEDGLQNTEKKVEVKINKPKESLRKETFVENEKHKIKEVLTLKQYQDVLVKKHVKTETDVMIIESGVTVEKPKAAVIELEDTNKNKMVMLHKRKKDYSHLEYPQRIRIPKELLKRDGTYKLNDCYYDHDGEFLYRVPGMD